MQENAGNVINVIGDKCCVDFYGMIRIYVHRKMIDMGKKDIGG